MDDNEKGKLFALVFFALFIMFKYYFCSFEDMKESIITAALIYGIIWFIIFKSGIVAPDLSIFGGEVVISITVEWILSL